MDIFCNFSFNTSQSLICESEHAPTYITINLDTMPILYSVISRGSTILAKNAECVGNFAEVTEQIINKISLSSNEKLTYSHGKYLIHYICEDRIIYMCITDDEFERARSFLFLTEIKRRFLLAYGLQAATAIAYAMNTEFSRVLASEMKHYSEATEIDAITKVHGQIDELKDIMVKNIGNKITSLTSCTINNLTNVFLFCLI